MTLHFWTSRSSNISWFRDTEAHCHCLLSARLLPEAEKSIAKMSCHGQLGTTIGFLRGCLRRPDKVLDTILEDGNRKGDQYGLASRLLERQHVEALCLFVVHKACFHRAWAARSNNGRRHAIPSMMWPAPRYCSVPVPPQPSRI